MIATMCLSFIAKVIFSILLSFQKLLKYKVTRTDYKDYEQISKDINYSDYLNKYRYFNLQLNIRNLICDMVESSS